MKNLAAKEIGDGREPDMRVGTDIGSLPGWDLRRPELVEKMNGPTICRWAAGKARRTTKPPRSTARGTIRVSMASAPTALG